MTTSITYNRTGLLWFTAYSSASLSPEYPIITEITQMITDGDGDVELRTGTTASSTKRDLLIVEYTQASIRAYIKHKKGDGSEAIQTGSGNLSYPPTENFFKKYYDMCEKFNHPTYNHVTFATGTFDNSNIAY